MTVLEVKELAKSYDNVSYALKPSSFSVNQGEFITLLGPSGCGKSTLIRLLTGILESSQGSIFLNGQDITNISPEKRDMSMVFQNYALFPHFTVKKNILFGLKMKKISPNIQQARFDHAVDICNLGDYLNRLPKQLSGGQQQRVALARAIVMEPSLLLFDEPLSNLDAKLRESLRDDLLNLHRKINATSIYVTHDQSEAMAMSDRVFVMDFGEIIESGEPTQLYKYPQHRYTANFFGVTNLLDIQSNSKSTTLPWGDSIELDMQVQNGTASVRPGDIKVISGGEHGKVREVTHFGTSIRYVIDYKNHVIEVNAPGNSELISRGSSVSLEFPKKLHMLVD